MTKSFLKQSTLFIAAVLILASCGKKAKQLNYIPKDVSGVVAIDAKKLALKSLELKDLLNADLFSKNLPTSKDSIIDKIKNSGVDLLNTAYVFGDVAKGDQKMYVAAVFALNDDVKFESTIKEVGKITEVKTDNDIKYAYVQDAIVGWKDKVGMVLALDGETDKEKSKAKLKELFTQPEENSLSASNEKFQTLLKEEADISLYLNYEKVAELLKQTAQMSALAGTNFKDTYLTATVNFENGKIVSSAKLYNNEGNAKIAKEFYKENVSKDLLKAHPGGDVIAFMSFGINIDPVVKYLREQKMLEDADMVLKGLGPEFDVNYVASALSGDFIGTLNAINTKVEDRMDYMDYQMKPTKVMDFVYSGTIGLKDAGKFQKLLDAVIAKYDPEGKGIIVKKDNYYSILNANYLVSKSNLLLISNNEALVKDAALNKVTPLSDANIDLMSSNTLALGIDASKVKPEVLDLMGKETTKIVNASPIESFLFSAEEVKSDVVTTKLIMNFKNKEQNSLISLQQAAKDAEKFMPEASNRDIAIPDTTVSNVDVEIIENDESTLKRKEVAP